MKELGIRAVYDLRSDTEIAKYNTPCPVIPGVDIHRTPVFKHEDYTPEMMAKCVSLRFLPMHILPYSLTAMVTSNVQAI